MNHTQSKSGVAIVTGALGGMGSPAAKDSRRRAGLYCCAILIRGVSKRQQKRYERRERRWRSLRQTLQTLRFLPD